MLNYVSSCFIPTKYFDDLLVWTNTKNGGLSLKQTYNFLVTSSPFDLWTSFSWNPCISPSKSMLIWCFLHNRLPTNENMTIIGFAFTSMCSLCNKECETSPHIFFDYKFVSHIWSWFKDIFYIHNPINNLLDCKQAMHSEWSPQLIVTFNACLVSLFA